MRRGVEVVTRRGFRNVEASRPGLCLDLDLDLDLLYGPNPTDYPRTSANVGA